jgi:hypothetical protein
MNDIEEKDIEKALADYGEIYVHLRDSQSWSSIEHVETGSRFEFRMGYSLGEWRFFPNQGSEVRLEEQGIFGATGNFQNLGHIKEDDDKLRFVWDVLKIKNLPSKTCLIDKECADFVSLVKGLAEGVDVSYDKEKGSDHKFEGEIYYRDLTIEFSYKHRRCRIIEVTNISNHVELAFKVEGEMSEEKFLNSVSNILMFVYSEMKEVAKLA